MYSCQHKQRYLDIIQWTINEIKCCNKTVCGDDLMDCVKMLSVHELERQGQEFFTKVQKRGERCGREMTTLIQTQKREINTLQSMSSFRTKHDSLLLLPDQRDTSWQRVQLLESRVKDCSQSTPLDSTSQGMRPVQRRKTSRWSVSFWRRRSLGKKLNELHSNVNWTRLMKRSKRRNMSMTRINEVSSIPQFHELFFRSRGTKTSPGIETIEANGNLEQIQFRPWIEIRTIWSLFLTVSGSICVIRHHNGVHISEHL